VSDRRENLAGPMGALSVENIAFSKAGHFAIGLPCRFTTRSHDRQRGELELLERRPWQPDDPLHRFSLRYDLMGPEEGLSQAERRQRLEAA
jgi:hypothetical protein